MKTFDEVSQYLMKKFYRVEGDSPARIRFKRNYLGNLFNELGYKTGAEVGVYRGNYSEMLCLGNPGVKLYCVDPWTTYESDGVDEPFAQDQKALDGFYEEAKKRLAPYNCTVIRKASMDAVKDFRPGELDFVYLDANHDFKHVTEDLAAWAKIVRSGGIVAGHDYGHFKRKDQGEPAKRAIDNYVKEHKIKMLFLVNQNYQTTWFFVKP